MLNVKYTDRKEGHRDSANENISDGQRGDEVVSRLPNLTVNLG